MSVEPKGIFAYYQAYADNGYLEFSMEEFTSTEDTGWETGSTVKVALPETLQECFSVVK